MVYGFKQEYIGKSVWAYLPQRDGSLEERHGTITGFLNQPDLYYMIKYDHLAVPHAASPEWLIFAPND